MDMGWQKSSDPKMICPAILRDGRWGGDEDDVEVLNLRLHSSIPRQALVACLRLMIYCRKKPQVSHLLRLLRQA